MNRHVIIVFQALKSLLYSYHQKMIQSLDQKQLIMKYSDKMNLQFWLQLIQEDISDSTKAFLNNKFGFLIQ